MTLIGLEYNLVVNLYYVCTQKM